jgi:hypothetical protein
MTRELLHGMDWQPVSETEQQRCGARPSPRSTAQCEMPPGHGGVSVTADCHAGRTRGGYWKFWPVEAAS